MCSVSSPFLFMIWNKNGVFSFISIKCQIIFCTDCVCSKLVEGSSYMGKECIGRPPLWHRNLAACWPWLEWIQLQMLGIQKCCLHRQMELLFSIWICQDNSFLPLLVLEYVHGWTARDLGISLNQKWLRTLGWPPWDSGVSEKVTAWTGIQPVSPKFSALVTLPHH